MRDLIHEDNSEETMMKILGVVTMLAHLFKHYLCWPWYLWLAAIGLNLSKSTLQYSFCSSSTAVKIT